MSQLIIPHTIGGARLAKPFNDNTNALQAWANGNIGQDNLAVASVGSPELVDGAVTSTKLGALSVTLAAVAAGAINYTKLANQLIGSVAIGLGPKALTNTHTTVLGELKITPAENCYLLIMSQVRSDTSTPALEGSIVFHRVTHNTTKVAEGHTHIKSGWSALDQWVSCTAIAVGTKNVEATISLQAISTIAGTFTIGGDIKVFALGRS